MSLYTTHVIYLLSLLMKSLYFSLTNLASAGSGITEYSGQSKYAPVMYSANTFKSQVPFSFRSSHRLKNWLVPSWGSIPHQFSSMMQSAVAWAKSFSYPSCLDSCRSFFSLHFSSSGGKIEDLEESNLRNISSVGFSSVVLCFKNFSILPARFVTLQNH